MKKTDLVYLEDILGEIQRIEKFLGEMEFSDFVEDEKTIFAVCHALEIVGEAANRLSVEFRKVNRDFPVRQAVEMRNFLIHGYDQIKVEVLWKTIKVDLPKLKQWLESELEDRE